jgi:hypothetical protein
VQKKEAELRGKRWGRGASIAGAHFFALKPRTKSSESITFDLPLPLGPTTEVMFVSNGPIGTVPAYDLKFVSSIFLIMRRCGGASGVSEGAGAVACVISASAIVSCQGAKRPVG